MMNFSSWSIKNPIPSIMLFVLLTVGGLFAFKSMKVQQMPDVELPMVTVLVALPGAAPNQLETEVAKKIENSLATIEGVKHIYSNISDSTVLITVEFRLEKAIQEGLDDVRSAVTQVRGDLPTSVNEPIVNKVNLAGSPLLAFTIESNKMDAQALSWYVDNDITKLLLSVPGVGAINRVGGVEREVTVSLDPLKIQSFGTTVADVSRQLANTQIERAGGKAELGGTEMPLRTLSLVGSAQDLEQLPLALSDGRTFTLGQVASIKDGFKKPTAAAFLDGKPVVGFEVVRSKGASDIDVGKGVRAKLKALKEAHPDLIITESFDFVTPIEQEFNASMELLYEGAILAVLVVWLFLRDPRATLISAVALPLSAIPAFIGMSYMGFSINIVTLLALSLVIGILVDDAIVEIENIVRHMHMGKTPYQAAMQAADEIGLAVIATTFTLIAVFLPTAFMSGIVGKFFKQFGWTAAFAIFASLIVARLLTPMMAAYLLKPLVDSPNKIPKWADNVLLRKVWGWTHSHPQEPRWLGVYMKMAKWCLRHRWITVALALLYFVGSLMLVPLIPAGFIPPDDNSQTQVYIELAPGAELSQTVQVAEKARQLMMQVPHIKTIYTTIGSGSAGSDPFAVGIAQPRKATLTIQLDERGERPKKQIIEKQMREKLATLAGVRTKVGLGGSGEKYQIAVTGDDANALAQAARNIERDLRKIAGVGNIESSAALVRREVIVTPNLNKAAEMGVTSASIAETLRVATAGDYDNMLAKLNLAQRQVPIVVRLADTGFQDLHTLQRLAVPSSKGSVMLGQVATLDLGSGPAVIGRMDRARNIYLNIELADIALGDIKAQVDQLPSIQNLPAGVALQEIGDAEANAEMAQGFTTAMLTGVLLIYIVLVLLFKTFLQPITILIALPLSFGGAFFALLLADKILAMPSLIGLLMLMGIATKNSILLVDYALELMRGNIEHDAVDEQHSASHEGKLAVVGLKGEMTRNAALLDACHKRARPIIMTSIAMGAGMLPVALQWGEADGSFRSPMAWAVIGGLVTSTLLSLLVIPPAFTLMDDFAKLFRRLFK